jgi:hypothetical protein
MESCRYELLDGRWRSGGVGLGEKEKAKANQSINQSLDAGLDSKQPSYSLTIIADRTKSYIKVMHPLQYLNVLHAHRGIKIPWKIFDLPMVPIHTCKLWSEVDRPTYWKPLEFAYVFAYLPLVCYKGNPLKFLIDCKNLT